MRPAPPATPPGDFTRRVLAVVRRIPPGLVATYGDVAAHAGRPAAARAVGNIMRTCAGNDVPYHRVVAAGGRLGGFGGDAGLKRALLVAEGVMVRGTRIVDFESCRWARGRELSARRARQRHDDAISRATRRDRFPV